VDKLAIQATLLGVFFSDVAASKDEAQNA